MGTPPGESTATTPLENKIPGSTTASPKRPKAPIIGEGYPRPPTRNCWSTKSAANIHHKNSSVALGLSSYSAHTTSCTHSHHRSSSSTRHRKMQEQKGKVVWGATVLLSPSPAGAVPIDSSLVASGYTCVSPPARPSCCVPSFGTASPDGWLLLEWSSPAGSFSGVKVEVLPLVEGDEGSVCC